VKRVVLLVVCLLLIVSYANAQAKAATSAKARVYQLDATPTTVAWGFYDAAAKPTLRIKSGESVRVHTLITSSPTRLEAAGVAPKDVEKDLRDIYEQVKEHGPGGHILTGPIYVEGAEPGDVLEIHFQKIDLAISYAYNGFGPRSGFIPEDYPYAKTKIIPLDAKRMVAKFAAGIEIPLHPFFGSVGDAPPAASGKLNSAPPSLQGGNLDNKSLVAGTTLYLPVYVPGALLEIGDGHAGMGDGEVDITALETSLYGTVRLIVRKDLHFTWPRAETPTEYISMGMNQDWNEAAKQALREMIDFLMKEKGLSKDDAYMLCSVAGDLHVTQLVDGNKGAHVAMPKAIFRSMSNAKNSGSASPSRTSM
jgi:acetamidase/formamidase